MPLHTLRKRWLDGLDMTFFWNIPFEEPIKLYGSRSKHPSFQ